MRRAHDQWQAGNVGTVVCLVPTRTDSTLFQETLSRDADVFVLQGRLRFLDPGGKRQPTPFSLMVLAFGATAEQRERFGELVPGMWMTRTLDKHLAALPPAAYKRSSGRSAMQGA